MLMETEKILENIGLTKNEIKIYLALLKLGQITSWSIIKETGVHTSKVYDGLQRLLDKGLVSYVIISNTKHFNATDPSRLLDFLDDKKRNIETQEKEIRKIIPSLKAESASSQEETKAEIFKGWKGMETVYKMLRETLKKGDINYVMGASKGEDLEQVRTFFNKHLKGLAEKRIKQKIIYNEVARGNIEEQGKHPKLFEIRYMKNTTPAEVNIWADKVMTIILTKNPTAILITDKKVADYYRSYFEILWKSAKK